MTERKRDSGPRARAVRGAHSFAGTLALYAGLFTLGTMLLGATAIAALVLPFTAAAQRERAARRLMMRTFRGYLRAMQALGLMRLDLSALDALACERSLILAPNHPCLLDAVLVISRLPDVVCVMKAELMDNVFLGAGARMAGFIRNDSARSMVRQAIAGMRSGGHLLVFPEGTRTVRPPVNPLKGAFALVAKRANVPIQMIYLETDSPFLSKGWPLWKRPSFPLVYRARLGPRVMPEGTVDEIIEDVSGRFVQALGEPAIRARAQAAAAGSRASTGGGAPARAAAAQRAHEASETRSDA